MGHLHGGKGLEGERYNVGSRSLEVQQASVVDPERDHDTRDDEELVECCNELGLCTWRIRGGGKNHTSQATANSSRRAFRDVKGRQHGRSTDAKAGDESTTVHHTKATSSS